MITPAEQRARSLELEAQLLIDKSLEQATWSAQFAMQLKAAFLLEKAAQYRSGEISP